MWRMCFEVFAVILLFLRHAYVSLSWKWQTTMRIWQNFSASEPGWWAGCLATTSTAIARRRISLVYVHMEAVCILPVCLSIAISSISTSHFQVLPSSTAVNICDDRRERSPWLPHGTLQRGCWFGEFCVRFSRFVGAGAGGPGGSQ